MGNRAVITTENKDLGVYLHWNGGRDSVEAFLMYCKLKGYRTPENDCYGWARLCQVIGNFFGGDLSIGIDKYEKLDLDNWDNGVYIIKDWKIVGREYVRNEEQKYYNLVDAVKIINSKQPHEEQLNEDDIDNALKDYLSITTPQIKAIHAIKSAIDWSDYKYRKIMKLLFGVTTCKELTSKDASVLIDMMQVYKKGTVE
jgi:hypothetical protein